MLDRSGCVAGGNHTYTYVFVPTYLLDEPNTNYKNSMVGLVYPAADYFVNSVSPVLLETSELRQLWPSCIAYFAHFPSSRRPGSADTPFHQ